MTRGEMLADASLEDALKEILQRVSGILGLVLTDANGIPVLYSLSEDEGIRESSAMSAVAVDVAVRMARHLNLGEFENVTFSFSDYYVYLTSLGDRKAHLFVLSEKSVNRGLLEMTVEEARRVVEKLLGDLLYL